MTKKKIPEQTEWIDPAIDDRIRAHVESLRRFTDRVQRMSPQHLEEVKAEVASLHTFFQELPKT